MLRDILKTNKIGNDHKLYIIAGLTIPFLFQLAHQIKHKIYLYLKEQYSELDWI